MQKRYLLIYHDEDNDGLFSAAIIYHYLVHELSVGIKNITLYGADYNNLASYAKHIDAQMLHDIYDTVIMTDISFNDYEYMKALYDEFGHDFVWFDHHAPIIKLSERNGFSDAEGIRDTTQSAILLAYRWFYDPAGVQANEGKVPELFRILSGWDSWSWEKEGFTFSMVRNVNKAITYEYELDFDKIYNFVHKILHEGLTYINISEYYKTGELLNNYEDRNMEAVIGRYGDLSWMIKLDDGTERHACAIFYQGATTSLYFQCLKDNGYTDNGIVFKHAPSGNWTMSLYNVHNEDDFHCGEFLKKKYGGGGHQGAAGCTLTQDQFIEILKNKKI